MSLTGYATAASYHDGTPQITKSFQSPTVIDHEDVKAWLRANPEIDYVAIPQTWYGHGATFDSLSNAQTIPAHYGKRAHNISYTTEYCFTRTQLIRYVELAEVVLGLVNDYSAFDESHASNMEHEAHREEMTRALAYELSQDDATISDWLDTESMSDWWQYIETDTDGITVYLSEDNLRTLTARWTGEGS